MFAFLTLSRFTVKQSPRPFPPFWGGGLASAQPILGHFQRRQMAKSQIQASFKHRGFNVDHYFPTATATSHSPFFSHFASVRCLVHPFPPPRCVLMERFTLIWFTRHLQRDTCNILLPRLFPKVNFPLACGLFSLFFPFFPDFWLGSASPPGTAVIVISRDKHFFFFLSTFFAHFLDASLQ